MVTNLNSNNFNRGMATPGNNMMRMGNPTGFAGRPQYLPGRFINNESEIVPGEVPMDGSISFFCTNDLSRIIIKQWNNSGLLDSMTYVIEQPNTAQQPAAQVADPTPAPAPEPQPDQMAQLQSSIEQLSTSIENAFNNLGGAFNQAIGSLNAKLDSLEGRG